MRKLLSSIIILLALCITCPQVYSGGTATQTVQLNEANLDTQYYFKWDLPKNSEMLVLVTVSMNINYMGKQSNITESRVFEVKACEQLSTVRHNPPYTIILSNNGGNWAYH